MVLSMILVNIHTYKSMIHQQMIQTESSTFQSTMSFGNMSLFTPLWLSPPFLARCTDIKAEFIMGTMTSAANGSYLTGFVYNVYNTIKQ